MGDVKHIVVTGASGFLGREIVRRCLSAGHSVTAISRRGLSEVDGCTSVQMDLAKVDAEQLKQALKGADALIHAAGEMSSDLSVHARSTLPATRAICKAVEALDIHLVHISSISVYDYMAVEEGGTLNEESELETSPHIRDGYVAAKLDQEELIADFCPQASALRVGAIYDARKGWNAHIGIGLGPALLRLAANGQIPLCHVARAAQVAIDAATKKTSGAVNVLDADLPDRVRFLEAFSKTGWPKLVIPVPWRIFDLLGAPLSFWKSRPGLLRRPVLHARMKPIGFDTALLAQNFPDLPQANFEIIGSEGSAK